MIVVQGSLSNPFHCCRAAFDSQCPANAMLCAGNRNPCSHLQPFASILCHPSFLETVLLLCTAHQDVINRYVYQLHHVTDHPHDQKPHPDCLADAKELALVGYTIKLVRRQTSSIAGGEEGYAYVLNIW